MMLPKLNSVSALKVPFPKGAYLTLLWACALSILGCEPQSDFCSRYVECEVHFENEMALTEQNTQRFQPDGVCWESAEIAAKCTQECKENLISNQAELSIRDLPIESCEISATEAGFTDGGTL